MVYKQLQPSVQLSSIIKSFWMTDSGYDKAIVQEKVIPDGYPEMIFHYKDPYKSNINGRWRDLGDKYIIAGQIRNCFFLENTGYTGMFSIKFQPWAFHTLFGINMSSLTDNAILIPDKILKTIEPLKAIAFEKISFEEKVKQSEQWIKEFVKTKTNKKNPGEAAVNLILDSNGQLSLDEILTKTKLSERQLERYFKKAIGLTPKFYCRIIRFAYIFKLTLANNSNWSEISTQAGFYDQSHFIKNFKEFTGEEPSKYGFTDQNLANLFLNA